MQSYIFGKGTPWTYEELTRKRRIADALAASLGTPRNVGEGLTAIGKALAARGINKRADARDAELKAESEANWAPLLAAFGGGMPMGAAPAGPATTGPIAPPDPNNPAVIGDAAMAALGKPSNNVSPYADAIASVESSGSGDYSAIGPETGKGRAYGRYQVMDFNIGPWTKKYLGREMSPEEFLANPAAQDAVFNGEFGGYIQQYGNPQDAASMWFSGRPMAAAGNASDGYMTVPEYVDKFSTAPSGATPASFDIGTLVQLAGDPYATPGQKAILEALLGQQMQAMDPMSRLDMERAQLEIEQLRNPPPEPADLETVTGPDGTVYSFNPVTGETKPLTGAEQPKPGFRMTTPVEAEAFGGPGQIGPDNRYYPIKSGPDTVVNVDAGSNVPPNDEALRKKLGEKEGEAWSGYLDAGALSSGTMQDMQMMDELIGMAPQGPISGRLAGAFPGISSSADAFNSIVKRVAPTLRAPGSGATSDIEYDGMLKSLPQLSAKPEANRAIAAMVKAKAQINMDRAAVVAEYQSGAIDALEARKRIQEINGRSIMTPELKAILGGLDPAQADVPEGLTPEEWNAMSDEDKALWAN